VTRPAVFLDRDGTIIEDVSFVGTPEQVRLLPGTGAAIGKLNDARIPVIVVTNQSGIARGFFSLADYERVADRTQELLLDAGAHIDASYVCPHHPDFTGPCDCRKPGPLLFERAAADHALDLENSWFVGDRLRDVSPARTFGGWGVLVPSHATPPDEVESARREFDIARSLDEAVSRVIESAR
jgi:D-glycero-D-manno-heptose 1,7-bisphosphate phosphatase